MKNFRKKNTVTLGKLINAVYTSYVYVYVSCASWSVRLEYNSLFVGLVVWLRGTLSEKFAIKSAGDKGGGLNV